MKVIKLIGLATLKQFFLNFVQLMILVLFLQKSIQELSLQQLQ